MHPSIEVALTSCRDLARAAVAAGVRDPRPAIATLDAVPAVAAGFLADLHATATELARSVLAIERSVDVGGLPAGIDVYLRDELERLRAEHHRVERLTAAVRSVTGELDRLIDHAASRITEIAAAADEIPPAVAATHDVVAEYAAEVTRLRAELRTVAGGFPRSDTRTAPDDP